MAYISRDISDFAKITSCVERSKMADLAGVCVSLSSSSVATWPECDFVLQPMKTDFIGVIMQNVRYCKSVVRSLVYTLTSLTPFTSARPIDIIR